MRFNKIAWIGLGNMGGPMAGHLAQQKLPLTAYNRSAARAQQWQTQHPTTKLASDLNEAVAGCDLIISCIGGDADIDAPITGGQIGAEQGTLAIMLGGDQRACDAAQEIVKHYSKRCERIGESGAGQLAKMVNQICYGGIVAGLAEALNFGEQAGLDMVKVLSVIQSGGAQSWQMDNRAQTMLAGEYDFGFAIDWVCKDLALVSEQAANTQTPLPLIQPLLARYQQLAALGFGRQDGSALIEALRRSRDSAATT